VFTFFVRESNIKTGQVRFSHLASWMCYVWKYDGESTCIMLWRRELEGYGGFIYPTEEGAPGLFPCRLKYAEVIKENDPDDCPVTGSLCD